MWCCFLMLMDTRQQFMLGKPPSCGLVNCLLLHIFVRVREGFGAEGGGPRPALLQQNSHPGSDGPHVVA